MKEDLYSYVGNSPRDIWVKIYDDDYKKRLLGNVPDGWFPWDAKVDRLPSTESLCIQIISENSETKRLPESVLAMGERVLYLGAPVRFLENVSLLPGNLKTLFLSGPGKLTFSASVSFQQIERLQVESKDVYFRHENFPNLKHLELKLDGNLQMLRNLPAFRNLRVLAIQPCSKEVLEVVSTLTLLYLRLNESKLETIEDIEGMSSLTDLWIHKWPNLVDLSPLSNLTNLEELTLSYCKRIKTADVLTGLTRMRRFFAWMCKNKFIDNLASELSKNGVDAASS